MKSQLERARAYTSRMEAAIEGSGGDKQTFIVACKLVEFGLGQSDAETLMREYNERCQPKWSEHDLMRKVKYAFQIAKPNPEFCQDVSPRKYIQKEVRKIPKWPDPNDNYRKKIAGSGFGMAELFERSPFGVTADRPMTLFYLRTLFPDNPLLCCGKNNSVFWTQRLSDFGSVLENYSLLVPNPMSAPTGNIKAPRENGSTLSAHSLENTGDRRYAVIEFDRGTFDEHAAALWHLSDFAPLVMAVHSGGKSLHGWFFIQGAQEGLLTRLYRYARFMGADPATHTKSQFVRMPDGLRENKNRQSVYYFNPEAIRL